MKLIKALFIVFMGWASSCNSNSITKSRLFGPGTSESVVYQLPSGEGYLVIQPTVLLRAGVAEHRNMIANLKAPFHYEFSALGAEKQSLLTRALDGHAQCDSRRDPVVKQVLRCQGSRFVFDLAPFKGTVKYIRLKRIEGVQPEVELYFTLGRHSEQSAYRSKLDWIRSTPKRRLQVQDSIYGADELPTDDLVTLAPLGQKGKDYLDIIVYRDSLAPTENRPDYPNYQRIGVDARAILPIYARNKPVTIQSYAFGESSEYKICWQPLAEPVDGRCYQTIKTSAKLSTHVFPRGRLILSADHPMAIDAFYNLGSGQSEQQSTDTMGDDSAKVNLQSFVDQFPSYPLHSGDDLSFKLPKFVAPDDVPVRINLWAVQTNQKNQGHDYVTLRVLGENGKIVLTRKIHLGQSHSPFDRTTGVLEALTKPVTVFLNANIKGGGRVVLSGAERSIFANVAMRRSQVPVFKTVHTSGYSSADSDRKAWNLLEPESKLATEMVFSYPTGSDLKMVDTGSVFYSSKGLKKGVFAMVETHPDEQSYEDRAKLGRYLQILPEKPISISAEGATLLPMVIRNRVLTPVSIYFGKKEIWRADLPPGNHDLVLSLPENSHQDDQSLEVKGAELFVADIATKVPGARYFHKRFFYDGEANRFAAQKKSKLQNLFIDVLLSRAPVTGSRVIVKIKSKRPAYTACCRDALTLLNREYELIPEAFQGNGFILGGGSAQLLRLAIPLEGDMPEGTYDFEVQLKSLEGAHLALSGEVPNHGVELRSIPKKLVSKGQSL